MNQPILSAGSNAFMVTHREICRRAWCTLTAANDLNRPVVVTVIAVRVVQVTINQVADVVAMRDSLVTAARAMHMSRFMSVAAMIRGADIRIAIANLNHMLVHVIFVRMMQVTIMQIVDVVAMLDGGMPAARPMFVRMIGVFRVRTARHDSLHNLATSQLRSVRAGC